MSIQKYVRAGIVGAALVGVGLVSQFAGLRNDGSADANSAIRPASELAREAANNASPFQAAILADGVVTREEYVLAAQESWQCMKDQGLPIGTLETQSDGTLRSTIGPFATYEEMQAKQPAVDGCNAEFRDKVSKAWFLQNQPGAATLAAARKALGSCLRDAGIAVPDGARSAEFAVIAQKGTPEFARCSSQVSDEFHLPNFGG